MNVDRSIRINGEIWNVADANLARQASGCKTLMLGRGALAAPDLARRIVDNDVDAAPMPWAALLPFIATQFERYDAQNPRYVGNRTKQWLAYLKRTYPEAQELFGRIRKLHDPAQISEQLCYTQPMLGSPDRGLRFSNRTESSDISRKVTASLPNQESAHLR